MYCSTEREAFVSGQLSNESSSSYCHKASSYAVVLVAVADMAYNDAANPEKVQIEQTAIQLQDGGWTILSVSPGIYRFTLR
jgi:hypothetical protein